jgi:hypothetical protein
MLKKLTTLGIASLFSLLVISTAVWAADPSVKIESPKDGATVKGSTLSVKFKFVKGGDADHVHLIVDGQFIQPIKGANTVEARDLAPGMHEITIQASKADHELIDVKDTVKIKVE